MANPGDREIACTIDEIGDLAELITKENGTLANRSAEPKQLYCVLLWLARPLLASSAHASPYPNRQWTILEVFMTNPGDREIAYTCDEIGDLAELSSTGSP